ncbi:MAG: hypothetical protein KKH51_03270 [Actinobacteria bacterium]|nr:hypothetical protein [Actinomycetota bacterium]
MTAAEGEQKRRGFFARVMRTRAFVIVAGALALALIATTVFVAIQKFGPKSLDAQAAPTAPSEFALELMAVGSAAVKRGETATLSLRGISDSAIARVELWEDDNLWVAIDDPAQEEVAAGQFVDLTIDYVPVLAGPHSLVARAIDAEGHVAQSLAMPAAVLDLPQDLVVTVAPAILVPGLPVALPISLHPVQGDTLAAVAGRLAVAETSLVVTGGVAGVNNLLDPRVLVRAPLPSATLTDRSSFHFPVSDWLPGISAKVDGCSAVVTSKNTSSSQFVYASPDFQRVGEVAAGGSATLSMLPLGTTTLVAYTPGSTSPSSPVSVLIPDECLQQGWTGDVMLSTTTLISSVNVQNAYLYLSIDQGEWQRVPANEGEFLPASNLVSIAQYLRIPNYDQLDLELWSYSDGEAARAASGQFCLKDVPNVSIDNSSGSGGRCMPEGARPGEGFDDYPKTIEISAPAYSVGASPYSPHVGAVPAELQAEQWLTFSGPGTVPLTITSPNPHVESAVLQFSYLPLSQSSTSIEPPGMFYSVRVPLKATQTNVREGSITIDPWQWRNAKASPQDSSTFVGDGVPLVLEDELALAVANANLISGKSLIDRIYVRAVASEAKKVSAQPDYLPSPLGFASENVLIDFTPPPANLPTIPSPSVTLVPGLAQSATDTAYNGTCLQVESYPDEYVWEMDFEHGPVTLYEGGPGTFFGYPTDPGDVLSYGGDLNYSDNAYAHRQMPDPNTVYCEDPSTQNRYFTYMNQAEAERDRIAEKCGIGCVLTTVLMAAYVGLLVGGPYGAAVGALIGLGLGLASVAIPGLYAILTQFWDAIAEVYNTVVSTALTIGAALNPVCAAAGAVDGGSDVKAACETATKAVGAAIFSAITGLPPQMPLHDTIAQATSGDMTILVSTAIDLALNELGVDCDDFTLESSTFVEEGTSAIGSHEAEVALASSKDANGDYSACQALATAIVKRVQKELSTVNSQLVSSLGEIELIPGFVQSPVTDTSPIIRIRSVVETAAPDPDVPEVTTCTAILNATVQRVATKNDAAYFTPKAVTLKPIEVVMHKTYAQASPDAPLTATWQADLRVPLLPDVEVPWAASLETAPWVDGTPWLTAYVDSPCFAETYVLTADKFDTAKTGFAAFAYDTRPSVYYLPDYFPFGH